MNNCEKFLELSENERSRYLAKNKLCFGCYDPISSNLSAKTCIKIIICKEYKNYHPTALHGYQYKKQNNAPGKNDDGKKKEIQLHSFLHGQNPTFSEGTPPPPPLLGTLLFLKQIKKVTPSLFVKAIQISVQII